MIVVDENVDQEIINRLEDLDYGFYSIREHNPGINDKDVIEVVKKKEGLLLTEDKDFGELVFAYNIKSCSIILLRYRKNEYEQIFRNIVKTLKMIEQQNNRLFFTITKNKIRVRKM